MKPFWQEVVENEEFLDKLMTPSPVVIDAVRKAFPVLFDAYGREIPDEDDS